MNSKIAFVKTGPLSMVALFLSLLFPGGCQKETSSHDNVDKNSDTQLHEERDDHEEEHKECSHGEHDQHKDENHVEPGHDDDHGEHLEDIIIELTKKGMALAEVSIEKVECKPLGRTIELPGEIGFNEDHLAHVTPRFGGVAKQVLKRIGAYVKKGEALAIIESNQSLSAYTIRAPINGRIIEKHITPGEFISEEDDMFVIANLATVWVNCAVYAKDAPFIKPGQTIDIRAVDNRIHTQATLSYIAPLYDKSTRSAVARAVIPNTGGKWRPGTFIQGTITVSASEAVPVVKTLAVQILHGEKVVFIPVEDHAFKPVEVTTGISDSSYVQLVEGLHIGDAYVANGAFELKAKVITSALGDHAGHGH